MWTDPVLIFLNAWLFLALVGDWPLDGPVPFKTVLRIVIEIVALILIDAGPYISTHVR